MPQFVIAYDIPEDRRRTRVAKVLKRYGPRLQQSVFTAMLDRSEHEALRRELGAILRGCDRVDILPVDQRLSELRVSWNREPDHTPVVIVAD